MTREAETLTGKFMVMADLQQPLEFWQQRVETESEADLIFLHGCGPSLGFGTNLPQRACSWMKLRQCG